VVDANRVGQSPTSELVRPNPACDASQRLVVLPTQPENHRLRWKDLPEAQGLLNAAARAEVAVAPGRQSFWTTSGGGTGRLPDVAGFVSRASGLMLGPGSTGAVGPAGAGCAPRAGATLARA